MADFTDEGPSTQSGRALPVTVRRGPEDRRKSSPDLGAALVMGGPAILLILLFLIGPFFAGIGFSFTDQRLISPEPAKFVGTRNYGRLINLGLLTVSAVTDPNTGQAQRDQAGNLQFPRSREFTRNTDKYPQYAGLTEWFSIDSGTQRTYILAGDPSFYRSLKNNILFSLIVIPVQSGVGLLLALLVNQKLRGRNFFRTMYFAPVVTSMVVVSIVWRFMYDVNNGLINVGLNAVSFGAIKPINWLGDPSTAMLAIIIMSIWQGAGFQMILFLAGLQGIPSELYEAASIDGANAWNKFRSITIPALRNTSIFIVVTITIAAFQLFTQVWVMTNGGPNDATTTVTYMMVRTGFQEQNIAYASAIAVVFFVIILLVNLVQRRVLRGEAI